MQKSGRRETGDWIEREARVGEKKDKRREQTRAAANRVDTAVEGTTNGVE